MDGTLAVALAVFIQLHLGDTAHDIYLGSVVAFTAIGAFHPEIFSFRFFGHKAVSATIIKSNQGLLSEVWYSHSPRSPCWGLLVLAGQPARPLIAVQLLQNFGYHAGTNRSATFANRET